jgi:hypothetical protein
MSQILERNRRPVEGGEKIDADRPACWHEAHTLGQPDSNPVSFRRYGYWLLNLFDLLNQAVQVNW